MPSLINWPRGSRTAYYRECCGYTCQLSLSKREEGTLGVKQSLEVLCNSWRYLSSSVAHRGVWGKQVS